MLREQYLVGDPIEDDASLIYSAVPNYGPVPQDYVNTVYSLITQTNVKWGFYEGKGRFALVAWHALSYECGSETCSVIVSINCVDNKDFLSSW